MGSFVPVYEHGECEYALFAVYTYGAVETYFYWHQYKPPFDSEQKRIELLNKLNAIDGVNLPPDAITKRPSIQLSVLAVPGRLDKLLAVYDWFIEEVRKTG